MKLLFGKTILYGLLIFIALECIVRVCHLYDQYPQFIINDRNVKTYAPNQEGYSVTGNRVMNFAQYHINKSGFNSYREFTPSKEKTDVAIIGDSFIEGLHQNYNNSIGKKMERQLNDGTEVFEYGHSGYDFADQLHLIAAYKEKFELIDYIIIYMKFENDLQRDFYKPDQYWIDSQYFLTSRIQNKIKLFNYVGNIGLFEPLRELKTKVLSLGAETEVKPQVTNVPKQTPKELKYLGNFKKLIETYGFDRNKTAILLDSRTTSPSFLSYCDAMNYDYIDFGKVFEKSKTPTTLIYDMHWNNHGRHLIASVITDYIKKKEKQP
ncbi:hypothetical protein [Mariniflexile maritimum]|jgi:hypothetical protein|uniref:hypothetical protein n=1 Tax=Mariniflexile maritimum TaxID=2682493 RepID=UPI0012F6B5A7|nr:hypothetical protein [Mariniflexile maritimum]MCB0450717.1 hypothetical protein [Confluentibacter sp.]HMR15596.1 hypothetical protein [Mariniflexile sp.]